MPEEIALEGALTDAIQAAVEAYAKSAAKSLLSDATSETIRAMSADAISALLGAVAGGLLKSILNLQDGVLKRVNNLVREPFVTGVRVANEALSLPAADSKQRQFRQARLQFAVEKLDEAESLAAAQQPEDVSAIAVIQVFCLSQIAGAQVMARRRASAVLSDVDKRIHTLNTSIEMVRRQIRENRSAAAYELQKLEDWPSNTFALLNPKRPSDYRTQSHMFTSLADQFEQQGLALTRRHDELQAIRAVLARI